MNKQKVKLRIKTFKEKSSVVSEAFFQILTLIISTFAFAFLIAIPSQTVEAQTASASYKCCEKTKTGEYCKDDLADNCDVAFKSAPTSCEATSFCKLGCCYDSVEGTCAENTPKKVCDSRNGTWDASADCSISQCRLGCCVLADQASLTTLVKCKKLSNYYGLEVNYRSEIKDEDACIGLAQAQDKGACVISTPAETTCKFTTRADCKTITNNQSAFYKDFLCSAEQLATNCARQHRTGCVEGKDEVYWFDSCGNAENIYDSDKTRSYNNGKVLSKEESCGATGTNINSKTCGNCNYYVGSMCGKYKSEEKEPKPTYGDYICRDINCYKTSNDKDYKHGESWCVYDEPAGNGRDPVGSRHFRHLCIMGEEKLEPCDDYRQSICIDGSLDVAKNNYTEAICRPNRWQDCPLITNQKDCENKDKRDCYWYQSEHFKFCMPNVPPGLKFWETGQGRDVCHAASKECEVTFEKKPLGGTKCVKNCYCLEESWTREMNDVCRSLGDCGAYVNFIGKATSDGYTISADGKKLDEGFMSKIGKAIGAAGLAILGIAIIHLVTRAEPFGTAKKPSLLYKPDIVKSSVYKPIPWTEGLVNLAAVMANTVKFASAGFLDVASLIPKSFSGWPWASPSQQDYIKYITNAMKNYQDKFYWADEKGITPMPAADQAKYAKEFSDNAYFGFKEIKGGVFAGHQKYFLTPFSEDEAKELNKKPGSSVTATETFFGTLGCKAGDTKCMQPKIDWCNQNAPNDPTCKSDITNLGALKEIAKDLKWSDGKFMFTQALKLASTAMTIYSIYQMINTLFGSTEVKKISFQCLPWQPPSGGKDCEKCNGDSMKPCSEYRCKSLGATCSLLNEGTGKETCVALNKDDTNSPILKPWKDVLSYGHAYIDVKPCPPGPGCWKITRAGAADGCIKAFTPLEFGISTNEPAQCKIDYNHTAKFDDMQFWFGDTNLYLYNRSMQMSLPGPNHVNAQSPELKNDGKYTLYIRCRDGNGNANAGEMAASFCVEPGPDTTPPSIEGTSLGNNAPIYYGANSTPVELYLNEPAECRWSFKDQEYANMPYTFKCALTIAEIMPDLTYRCSGNLTNIQDKVANNYYIRCKDQPWLAAANESERNVNKESYVLALQGTIPLNITKVGPNGTIEFGKEPVPITLKVETANGYSAGLATCYYSDIGYNNMIEFFKTDASEHEQILNLFAGNYTYYVLCRDLAGNIDKNYTKFRAEVDNKAPWIIRVYQDAGMLKIITDEESECRYSIKSCNFDFSSATEMPFSMTTEHTAEWRTDITYYIKCKDEFGNMPAPSECSMQVNAYDVKVAE